MTQKYEPELVTSGPYRLVRHPIYSGVLVAGVGTTVALSWPWLIAVGLAGSYFLYSATVEERYLTEAFPVAYPCTSARPKCSCRSSSDLDLRSGTAAHYAYGVGFHIVQRDALEWMTRPHEPGEAARHVAELQ